MELRHLRYFVMVAEEENISRAAARLNISQPAVSRQIQDLEDELGVTLFKRERIGLSLTAAGQTALVQAKMVLRQVGGLTDALRPFQNSDKAETLKVAYLPTAPTVFLTDGLRQFNKTYTKVCVQIFEMSPKEQVEALRGGEIDLALLGQDWASLRSEFEVEALHKTPIALAVPEEHRLAARKSVDLSELKGEAFVSLSEKNFPTRPQMLTNLFGKAGFEPNIVMKAKGLSELLGIVGVGTGISLVPMELNQMPHPRVVFVKLRRPTMSLRYSAVWRKGDGNSHVSRLVNILKDV